MTSRRPSLTPFKLRILRSLYPIEMRSFGEIEGHRPHKRRALRDLETTGLVSQPMNGWWCLTRYGAAAAAANTLRDAEQTIANLRRSEQLFEP